MLKFIRAPQGARLEWRLFTLAFLLMGFASLASGFSEELSEIPTNFELGIDAINTTALERVHHQHSKRARTNRRANVIYGDTCSDAQVTYLDTALSEAGDMASRAFTAIDELIQIFKDREQPEHWPPASYTRRYRNLLLWGSFFGEPMLRRGVGKLTIANTIAHMEDARGSYRVMRDAFNVRRDEYHMQFHCNDDWAIFSHIDQGGNRVYRDMRFPDQDIKIKLKGTCHENPVAKAFTFPNELSGNEETVICPKAWELWAGHGNGFIADFQGSSFAAMRGKKLQEFKERAAAGTMLHEASHSVGLLGEDKATEDVRIQYQGKTRAVYGTVLCRELARTFTRRIGQPIRNADTLSLFALGVYYSQCNWANPTKPGFCKADAPDMICPTVDGSRRCVTFDWGA